MTFEWQEIRIRLKMTPSYIEEEASKLGWTRDRFIREFDPEIVAGPEDETEEYLALEALRTGQSVVTIKADIASNGLSFRVVPEHRFDGVEMSISEETNWRRRP